MENTHKQFHSIFLVTLLFLTYTVLPLPLSAQLGTSILDLGDIGDIAGNPLFFETKPRAIRPNTPVEVRIVSYRVNMTLSHITWTVNGETVASGTGTQIVMVTPGGIGTETDIVVSVTTPDGREYIQTTTLYPADVLLVWEAQTYVPPFYRGRRLQSAGSDITIVAYPFFETSAGRMNPDLLVYNWRVNGKRENAQSGVGRRYLVVKPGDIPRPHEIILEISTQDKTRYSNKELIVPLIDPVLRFYEDDPVLGIRYGHSLNSLEIVTGEATVAVEPYFFSTRSPQDSALEIVWSIGGEKVSSEFDSESITLRPTGEGKGKTQVQATIKHIEHSFQRASMSFPVTF
jgi:hypothetical protein